MSVCTAPGTPRSTFIGVKEVALLAAAVVVPCAAMVGGTPDGTNSNFMSMSFTGICDVNCDWFPSPLTMSTMKPVAPKYQRTVDIATAQPEQASTGKQEKHKLAR